MTTESVRTSLFGFNDNSLNIRRQVLRQIGFEQSYICVQDNSGQEIAKVMGNAGRQLTHRRQPLVPPQLLFHPLALGDVLQAPIAI